MGARRAGFPATPNTPENNYACSSVTFAFEQARPTAHAAWGQKQTAARWQARRLTKGKHAMYALDILKNIEVTPADYDEVYRLFGPPGDGTPCTGSNFDDDLALAMAIIRQRGPRHHRLEFIIT